MMLKLKIYTTILFVYEILAVLLLHCPRTCDSLFGVGFCDDRVFKYFIACFAIPALVFLIVMWIMEIVSRARRRRTLMYKAKSAVKGIVSNVREKVSEKVSSQDLEKLAVAALLAGVKKYSHKYPKVRSKLNELLDTDIADYEDDEYSADDDEEDDDERGASRGARAKTSKRGFASSKSGGNKSKR